MPSERTPSKDAGNPVSEVVALVKGYADQEIRAPLRNLGRWVGLGLAGAILLGVGGALVLLGLLRLLQGTWMGGRRWSWLPYLITLVACGVVIAGAVTAMSSARKEKR
jgi:predicted cobalt transporter CbtA